MDGQVDRWILGGAGGGVDGWGGEGGLNGGQCFLAEGFGVEGFGVERLGVPVGFPSTDSPLCVNLLPRTLYMATFRCKKKSNFPRQSEVRKAIMGSPRLQGPRWNCSDTASEGDASMPLAAVTVMETLKIAQPRDARQGHGRRSATASLQPRPRRFGRKKEVGAGYGAACLGHSQVGGWKV